MAAAECFAIPSNDDIRNVMMCIGLIYGWPNCLCAERNIPAKQERTSNAHSRMAVDNTIHAAFVVRTAIRCNVGGAKENHSYLLHLLVWVRNCRIF